MHAAPSTRYFLLLSALLSMTIACGESVDDGSDDKGEGAGVPALSGGKADTSGLIVEKGALELGEAAAVEADIAGRGQFHAYEIALPESASIDLEITQKGSTRDLNTTLYVYGPRDDAGQWSSEHIAFDDDDGWGPLSRIRGFEAPEAGTYLVLVGTYSGKQNGHYRIRATCANEQCDAQPAIASVCAFGAHYNDLFTDDSAMTLISQRRVTSADTITDLERDQIVASVASTYDMVTTISEAFGSVDAGQVNISYLWDASTGKPFVAYEFGAGDNSYGMIAPGDGTQAMARIQDGEITDCRAEWGEGRRLCSTDAECGAQYQCNGMSTGPKVCAPRASAPGTGEICATSADCPGQGALVCAGESTGRGSVCVQSWMKRGFGGELYESIPAGPQGTTIELESYGLATVHTDVWLDLSLSTQNPSAVMVTLTNPGGTTTTIAPSDGGEYYLRDSVMNAFPGDEDANGVWRLHIVNTDTSGNDYTTLYHFGLKVASRWD